MTDGVTTAKDTLRVTITTTSAIEGIEKNIVTIFPNPAQDVLSISNTGANSTYLVINTTGLVVLSSQQRNIDISSLDKGVYFVLVGHDLIPFVKK